MRTVPFNLVVTAMTCTNLNGEDGCIPDQKRFDLEGLAEGSSLVHGAHRCRLVCIDVLSQLLSEVKKQTTLQLQRLNFHSKWSYSVGIAAKHKYKEDQRRRVDTF